jgi:glutaryl-CoA dehydrogenase
MASPTPFDFMDTRSLLNEEEQAVQASVARFVDERVIPVIGECFEQDRFPRELVATMAEMGLFGVNLSGYGCAGMNNVAYGLVCQELERGDSGVRSFVSVQNSLCMFPIHQYGSEQQKQRWLPEMAAGRLIGCFGLTEADGGSDPGTMKTRARKDGNDWILSGSKMWITNGTLADLAIVWAMTDEGVRGFVVEKDTKGFTAQDIKRKLSLRASITSELYFDDCRLSESHRLPGAVGLSGPLSCLTNARYGIVWGVLGAAIACLEEARHYSAERILFGRPLSHTQTIQRRLAEMVRRIATGQLLALQLGRLKDAGRLHHAQVSLAKWNNCRLALDIARDARDILGGAGITLDHHALRHALNLESVITYEGTETVHELVIGRELTGVAAF